MRATRRGKARHYQMRRYEKARHAGCVTLRAVAGLHGIGVVPAPRLRPRRAAEPLAERDLGEGRRTPVEVAAMPGRLPAAAAAARR